ncbi:MAG: hypothetical protein ACREKE_05585, partial [bacterium]
MKRFENINRSFQSTRAGQGYGNLWFVCMALLLFWGLAPVANAATTFGSPPDGTGSNSNLTAITVTSSGLSGACPGDTGNLTLTFYSGPNAQYNSQQISVYGEILTAADDGGCNGFTNTCNPNGTDPDPAWWVIEKNTAVKVNGTGTMAIDPGTDSCSEDGGNTWPNNGGWDEPTADNFTAAGETLTASFDIEVPAEALPDTTYYLEVGVNYGNYQNQTGASEGYVCIPFTTGGSPNCTVPSTVTLSKVLESDLTTGQDSLYLVNYDFTTGSNNYVIDSVPPCLTILDESTNPSGGGKATVNAGTNTITWSIPNASAASPKSGQLYIEVEDTCANGTQVVNTANASTSGAGGASVASASVSATAGSIQLTLTKQQYDNAALQPQDVIAPGATLQP